MGLTIRKFKDCKHCRNSIVYGAGDKAYVNCISKEYASIFKSDGQSCATYCAGYIKDEKADRGHILIPDALEFMTAGNAEFALHSTKTEETFTYKLKKKETDGKCIYWLSIGTGDNMVYAGTIWFSDRENEYVYSKGKSGNVDSSNVAVRSLLMIMNRLHFNQIIHNCEVYHMGKCKYCGNKLEPWEDMDRCICNKCKSIQRANVNNIG